VLGGRRTLATLVASAVVTALAVGACGGDDDSAEPVDELDTGAGEASGTTAAASADEAAVVAAYEAHWQALLAAGDPPDPQSPGLAETMTGDALRSAQNFMSTNASEGLALRGTYTHDAVVTTVTDTTATVEDCGEDGTSLVVASTGEAVESPDETPEGIVAELAKENGAWKVSTLRYDEAVCA
jgi:hypothetical protein